MRRLTGLIALMFCLLWAMAATAAPKRTVIKLGTVAPEGSVWHDALLGVRQEWREITQGEVELRIYAGGVLGGEDEMVRKMQRRGLDAIAISGAGLPLIDRSVECLNIPLLFDTYEELDYVRERIAPRLEARLAKRNVKLLNWAEAGWVHFFTKQPARTPDDIRRLRLWIAAGEPQTERLFKDFGFKVVPLPVTDMLTSLQTGLIEAIDVPPLFALLDRSYQQANYMLDLNWAPLNAATVISMPAWQRIPEHYRPELLAVTRRAGRSLREAIRQAGDEAVVEMQARGLQVMELDAPTRDLWHREVEGAWPRLRGTFVEPSLYDEVMRLREEYRNGRKE